MDGGWSLKHLHKLIMTSTAFRQGHQRSPDLAQRDPDNRLLGAFPVRRLEAEILRDAVLAVSGRLNRKAFGVAVPVTLDPAGEIVIGEDSENAGIARVAMPMFGEEWRRSVYVQSRRTMPLSFMQVFDAPAMEPNCEARTTSTVAPQSLVLLNSPFILQQSLDFAQRLRTEAGGDAQQQVGRAWKLAYSRAPTPEELADAVAFLEAQSDFFRAHPPTVPKQSVVPGSRSMGMRPAAPELLLEAAAQAEPELLALALLCQMLISSNEFLYAG
jgi:hypothetical protein